MDGSSHTPGAGITLNRGCELTGKPTVVILQSPHIHSTENSVPHMVFQHFLIAASSYFESREFLTYSGQFIVLKPP